MQGIWELSMFVCLSIIYYTISYNLCTTDCLIEYLYSVILQMGHPKCLP